MPTREGNDGPRRLWTAEDVAEFLGLHPQTVYAKANRGEIPSFKVGVKRRFRPEEIEAWLDSQPRMEPETEAVG